MIGYIKSPTGRMGNVLIQYVFLRQVADRIGTDYFHCKLPYSEYFDGFDKRNLNFKLKISPKWKVTHELIESIGMGSFIEKAIKLDVNGKNIVLEPPMLGYLFYDKNDNPAKYISIRSKYKKDIIDSRLIGKNVARVGIHFRGGDFKEWNEKASLPFEYYRTAIDYVTDLLETSNKTPVFQLFKDDKSFESYIRTLKYLKENNATYIDADNLFIEDFYQLSLCDMIISSPSTFAIFAGLIGKNKSFIHSSRWVDYCAANNESFWIDIKNNAVPYYRIEKII